MSIKHFFLFFKYNKIMSRKIVTLLDYKIDTFTFAEAIEYAKQLIDRGSVTQVVTINPEMIELGDRDKNYKRILDDADLVIPDGVGIQLGLKIESHNVQRIAGIEFAYKMLEVASQNDIPVALVGAKREINEQACKNLRKDFPNLNIVYSKDGYFENNEEVFNELKQCSPRLILVALGAPKQEEFINHAKNYINPALMIGVGGSFDVWAGAVERAPEIYRKLGLEWLYRTVKQPQRFKRIFPTLPLFIWKVMKEKFNL